MSRLPEPLKMNALLILLKAFMKSTQRWDTAGLEMNWIEIMGRI
jgi:hypothetical protein